MKSSEPLFPSSPFKSHVARSLMKGRTSSLRSLLLALVVSWCFVSNASAQSLDGTIRIGLDQGLLQYSNDLLVVPRGDDIETTRTHFSLLSAGVGLVVGGNLSERLSIGGRVLLDRDSTTADDVETINLRWQVGPTLEYRFTDQGVARPFGQVGLFLAGEGVQVGDMDAEKWKAFGFHFGGGVHVFLHERVSIDPQLEFAYQVRLGDVDAARWTVGILVGLTAWIGGGSPDAAAENETYVHHADTPPPPPPPAAPQIQFAREGERKVAARLVLETADSTLAFTYNPGEAPETAQVDASSRTTRPLPRCDRFTMQNGDAQVSAAFDGRSAHVSMNDLLASSQGDVVVARFCTRIWRPNAMDQQAFRRFAEEAWAMRNPAPPADAAAPTDAAVPVDATVEQAPAAY